MAEVETGFKRRKFHPSDRGTMSLHYKKEAPLTTIFVDVSLLMPIYNLGFS